MITVLFSLFFSDSAVKGSKQCCQETLGLFSLIHIVRRELRFLGACFRDKVAHFELVLPQLIRNDARETMGQVQQRVREKEWIKRVDCPSSGRRSKAVCRNYECAIRAHHAHLEQHVSAEKRKKMTDCFHQ